MLHLTPQPTRAESIDERSTVKVEKTELVCEGVLQVGEAWLDLARIHVSLKLFFIVAFFIHLSSSLGSFEGLGLEP